MPNLLCRRIGQNEVGDIGCKELNTASKIVEKKNRSMYANDLIRFNQQNTKLTQLKIHMAGHTEFGPQYYEVL